MTDSDDGNTIPSSGTHSIDDATADTKRISTEIYDLIGIKGKTSEPGPGVSTCDDDKDRDKFYKMLHSWSFTPTDPDQLPHVMERLKKKLPTRGWKIITYETDTSPNKNLNLTADNNKRGFGVNIVYYHKNNPPNLGITVVSGCYQVPKGQRVDRY